MTRIEDFYDKPPPVVVVLLGGPRDGERMTVPEGWLPVLQLPLPQKPMHLLTIADMDGMAADALRPMSERTCAYRWSGSIGDDGTRVCAYLG